MRQKLSGVLVVLLVGSMLLPMLMFMAPMVSATDTPGVGYFKNVIDTNSWNCTGILIGPIGDNLLYICSRATIAGDADANIGKATYSISTDTWSSFTTIYDSSYADLGPSGGIINGNIFVFLLRRTEPSTYIDIGYIISTDNGNTWSSFTSIDMSSYAVYYPYGHIVKTENTYYQPFYCDNGGNPYYVKMFQSTDNGTTWTIGPTICSGDSEPSHHTETSVEYIGENKLIALMRTEYSGFMVNQAVSSDGGATWSSPDNTNVGVGGDVNIPFSIYDNGKIFLVFANRGTQTIKISDGDAMSVFDNCLLWDNEKILRTDTVDQAYPSIAKMGSTRYYIIWTVQENTSDTWTFGGYWLMPPYWNQSTWIGGKTTPTVQVGSWSDTYDNYYAGENENNTDDKLELGIAAVGASTTTTDNFYSTLSDGIIYKSDAVYATAQSSATGTVAGIQTTARIGQAKTLAYRIDRSFLFFDTSTIPDDATITGATLSIYGSTNSSTTDFAVVIQNGQPDYPTDPLATGDYLYSHYADNGGSMWTSGYITTGYNDIALTENAYENWIRKDNTTKLCLRSSKDISATAPTGNEYVLFFTIEYGQSSKYPKLAVTYTVPVHIYHENAYVESSLYDSGSYANWKSVYWTASTPTGTSLTVKLRSGNTENSYDGSWSDWCPFENGAENDNLPNSRYVQYRIDLSTTDNTVTPEFYDITITYENTSPPPTQPVLSYPNNEASISDNTPTLEWTNGENADNHHLLVDTDSSFLSPVVDVTLVVPENTYTTTILDNGIYYWKVIATNSSGENSSDVWWFKVLPPLPTAPTLISPANWVITSDNTPTFTWTIGAYFDNSRVQVSINADFSDPIIDENLDTPTSEYTPTNEMPWGDYYWRVAGVNATGETWSENWRFVVWPTTNRPITVADGQVGMVISLSVMGGLVGGMVFVLHRKNGELK